MTTQMKPTNRSHALPRRWHVAESGKVQDEMVLTNKLGLDLRAAAELVKVASKFKSRIVVQKNDDSADAKSLIELIALAVVYGTRLKFNIQGEDAVEALEAVRNLVRRKFGESK